MRTRTRSMRWAVAAVAATTVMATACSGGSDKTSGAASAPLHHETTTTTEPVAKGPVVDACAVLAPAAAATVVGGAVKADNNTTIMPTKGPAPVKCQYQAAANQQLVLVVVTKRTEPLNAVIAGMRKSNNKLVSVTAIGDAAFFDNSTVGLFVVFSGDWLLSFSGPKTAPLSAWKALAPSALAALPKG